MADFCGDWILPRYLQDYQPSKFHVQSTVKIRKSAKEAVETWRIWGEIKKMFIPVDIQGTHNTFIPLPTCSITSSLSLERKRSALCQLNIGFTWCMWVIRCLLKMSLAVKHRAGKQHLWCSDFSGVRVQASRKDEWGTWHLYSENVRQLLVLWFGQICGKF